MMAFTAVILVTIGTVFFFINQATQEEIRQLEERDNQMLTNRMQIELSRYYLQRGNWRDIQPFIEQWGNLYEKRIILTDSSGTVVADSEGDLLGELHTPDSEGSLVPFGFRGSSMGTLYVTPVSSSEVGLTSLQVTFKSIGLFFIWGGLFAGAIALLMTFFMSRRILAPVKSLASAAVLLGKGDFRQRVQIRDKGELGQLADTFNSMVSDLERAEQLRRNMVADIAHELRTPLSNIRGYLEAVRDGIKEPDTDTISSLEEEASLLSRLVDDLQELSLAEAGELTLVRSEEDVAGLVRQAVTAVEGQSSARGLSLTVELPDSLLPVNVDSHRIGQVLRNLLENAIAHTDAGGTITVAARQLEGYVEVSVTDTGEGIPSEDLPNIFERFYRVDKARSRKLGGTGLGLAIVKHIAQAHGGRATVQSTPGKGSTFTIHVEACQM